MQHLSPPGNPASHVSTQGGPQNPDQAEGQRVFMCKRVLGNFVEAAVLLDGFPQENQGIGHQHGRGREPVGDHAHDYGMDSNSLRRRSGTDVLRQLQRPGGLFRFLTSLVIHECDPSSVTPPTLPIGYVPQFDVSCQFVAFIWPYGHLHIAVP